MGIDDYDFNYDEGGLRLRFLTKTEYELIEALEELPLSYRKSILKLTELIISYKPTNYK